MKGVRLTFYTYELQKHQGILMYEWLLEFARKKGIHGGSAFRGIAGFGKHGIMHEEHFFELASNVPVEVTFIVSQEEGKMLIDLIKQENVDLVYVMTEVHYGRLTAGANM
jgi:uncharacterized protein